MRKSLTLSHHLAGIAAMFLVLMWFAYSPGRLGGESPRGAHNVKEIGTDDAKLLIDNGAVVIDVRPRHAYDVRHVPGALHIPLEELRQAIPAQLAAARDKTIVVYCNEGTARGPESTSLLNQAGFSHAVNLKTGIEGWAASGLPLVKGG